MVSLQSFLRKVASKINRALSSLSLVSKLEVLDSKLKVLNSKLEVLDSRLDTRSFRVSRIEDRVEAFEYRGTVNLLLPGTVEKKLYTDVDKYTHAR